MPKGKNLQRYWRVDEREGGCLNKIPEKEEGVRGRLSLGVRVLTWVMEGKL